MATLIQLSATSWLNIDSVTVISREGEQWSVWVGGQEAPLSLTPEEARAIAYYVQRHAEGTAYGANPTNSS